jgi:carboxypeptidase Taq
MSAQIWDTARAADSRIEEEIKRGEFTALRDWLTQNLYQHGRKYSPPELAVRVTGKPLGAASFINYLQTKFNELYGVLT